MPSRRIVDPLGSKFCGTLELFFFDEAKLQASHTNLQTAQYCYDIYRKRIQWPHLYHADVVLHEGEVAPQVAVALAIEVDVEVAVCLTLYCSSFQPLYY